MKNIEILKRSLIALFIVTVTLSCLGQTTSFGAPIGKGSVGYRLEWVADQTRSWEIPDSFGHLHASPRWVRVHTWYPAVAGTGDAMRFRDYIDAPRPPIVPEQVADTIHGNDLGDSNYSFRGIYRDDVARFDHAMNTPMAARSWADPASGKFPVVVYSLGQNDFTQDAVSLAEFLASNGFIVTTVPHLGTNSRRAGLFVHDPLSYETQLRDLELALNKALKLKIADDHKIVAVGHSYGGIYALLLAMRSDSISGVIGLDPTYISQRAGYEYDLHKFPFFHPDLSTPIVTLRRGTGNADRSLIDSFVHADRLEIIYPELLHGDFTTVAFLKRDLPSQLQMEEEIKVRSPQMAAEGATVVFNQTLISIQQILAGQKIDAGIFSTGPVKQSVSYTPAVSTPSEEELYWIYRRKGLQAAEDAVNAGRSASGPVFDESRTITIAKELSYSGKAQESLDMFRLAAFAFPESSNAQFVTADALLDAGLKDEARPILQKALQLDPNNQAAKDALSKLNQ